MEFLARRIAESKRLRALDDAALTEELAFLYDYANYAHPFREGNGRTQREFFDQLLSESGRGLAWQRIEDARLHSACHRARQEEGGDLDDLLDLFQEILTHDPAYR